MIIGVYGFSKSGKTTLVERLVKELCKKYKVATIKHISEKNFSIDKEGKDTYRHRKSGANLTIAFSENETVFIFGRMKFEEVLKIIENFNFDLVIVEGFKSKNIQKIAVGKIKEKPNTIFRWKLENSIETKNFQRNLRRNAMVNSIETKNFQRNLRKNAIVNSIETKNFQRNLRKNAIVNSIEEILSFIEQSIKEERIYEKLPKLNCMKCGFDCFGLAKEIAKGKKKLENCSYFSEINIEIKVNGKKIPLGKFTKEIISSTIKGMVSSLKEVKKIKEVEVRIK